MTVKSFSLFSRTMRSLSFAIVITLLHTAVKAELNYAAGVTDMGNQLQKPVIPPNPYALPYYPPYQTMLQSYQQQPKPQVQQQEKAPFEVDLGELLAKKVKQDNIPQEQQPQQQQVQQLPHQAQFGVPAIPPIPGLPPFQLPIPQQLPATM